MPVPARADVPEMDGHGLANRDDGNGVTIVCGTRETDSLPGPGQAHMLNSRFGYSVRSTTSPAAFASSMAACSSAAMSAGVFCPWKMAAKPSHCT